MTSLHPLDLGVMANCKKLVEFAIREHGRIDVLFNNAAKAWDSVDLPVWNQNVGGPVRKASCAPKSALPHPREPHPFSMKRPGRPG